MASFEDLLAEGAAVPVEGWDFSWFAGRATEQRPSWGYARLLARRLAAADAALDVQTGGGEVFAGALAGLDRLPAVLAATESWPPNLVVAARNLDRFGVSIVDSADDAPLPFPDASFDLVASRHPTVLSLAEVARVLRPGGTFLSQMVGPGSVRELTDFMMGPQPVSESRSPARAAAAARDAGLTVVDLREAALRMEFHDVAAVAVFLRKVIWIVPGFTIGGYRERLAAMHERIRDEGPFVAHARRFLVEARKPD